jgi:hypothetical protein
MSFNNKKILFICSVFYGYELLISNELRRQGLIVSDFFFVGFSEKWYKGKRQREKFHSNFFRQFKEKLSSDNFDLLFVINTDLIDSDLMSYFKTLNPGAKTIIYLWDSIANLSWQDLGGKLKIFDLRYSFDRVDCENHKELELKHRPNFYHPYIDNIQPNSDTEYKIASVMSIQPDRIKFLNRFRKYYPGMSVFFYVHLLTLKSFPAYLLNQKVFIRPEFIHLRRLDIIKSLEMLNKADCILDIPARNQNGLPFRSLDAIGLNKKLITTNIEIINYDFYNQENVLLINHDQIPEIDEFLKLPFRSYPYEIRTKYSISGWVKEILNIV